MGQAFQQQLSRLSALKPARPHREPVPETRPADDADRLAPLLGAEIARNRHGEFLVARQWHATPEMCEPDADVLRLLLPPGPRVSPYAVERAADPSTWLFLDTETTGLAGGTGTYAFLVGLAWWDAGGIQIEQLFMRDHAEEHSVLLEVARRLSERPVLVTFNGKTFDWPLLETRFRMTRSIAVPEFAAHLDLLHPARQLWRWQVGSVRLKDLERHVLDAESLGWSRGDDIDSSRIPEFYFDYLRGGAADPLAGVFRHNRMDLRGLAALAGRLFQALGISNSAPRHDQAEPEPLELYGISRFLERRGERARALHHYERALDAGLPAPVGRDAQHALARLAKRQRNFARAAELWHELAVGPEPSLEACEQLAIHYERQVGDVPKAERIARLALRNLRQSHRLGLVQMDRYARLSARLQSRIDRLERKLQPKSQRTAKQIKTPPARIQREFGQS